MINKESFYKKIRVSLFDKLTQSQVNGMEAILNEWDNEQYSDTRMLAYMLATVYHETARTMQPIEEYGKGKGRPYGVPNEKKIAYYGRGFVQLTWDYNYKKAGNILGIDLLNKPELALQLDIATKILFKGMFDGWFTGKKLSNYIGLKCDFVGARKIINGTDKASTIASYANGFLTALK